MRFRHVFGFALLTTFMLAPGAAAQTRTAEDARIIDNYRLTMPMLRKVLPALYAPGADRCSRENRQDPHKMSISGVVGMLERCAAMAGALRSAGVPVRDGAIVLASLLRTAEVAALHGGKVSAIAPGVHRDNALLMERNDAEIQRMMKTEGPS